MSQVGKEYWDKEYSQGSPHLQALASGRPSSAATKFVKYLEQKQIPFAGRLVEVGCGMGRNANYLAGLGFTVSGFDISEVAVTEAQKRAKMSEVKVDYQVVDIARRWSPKENSLDYIVDLATSHLLTLKELRFYREEILRTLKPEGRFLIYTLDRSKDKEAQKLLESNPGPEDNTYVLPEMGHVERTFDLDELRTIYFPLQVEHQELIYLPTNFGGKTYDRYYWWVIMQKKSIISI